MQKKKNTDYDSEFDFEREMNQIFEEEFEEKPRRSRSKKTQKVNNANTGAVRFLIGLIIVLGTLAVLIFVLSRKVENKDQENAVAETSAAQPSTLFDVNAETTAADRMETTAAEITTAAAENYTILTEASVQETFTEAAQTTVQETAVVQTAAPETAVSSTLVAPIPVQGGITIPSWITQDLLTPSPMHRPQIALTTVNNIVVHYVANEGSSAKGNKEYFEENVDGRQVSSHFIVGLNGEILQCIPLNEVAYAQGSSNPETNRNYDCISIENCHPDSTGQFSSETYWALVRLCAWLCEQYHLTADALIRHYDVTGKPCPVYYVEHEDAWIQFKESVRQFMAEHPDIATELP